ncbi:response regulator, partial [Vibrio parahaemolyticus VPTS-2010]
RCTSVLGCIMHSEHQWSLILHKAKKSFHPLPSFVKLPTLR